MIQVKGDQGAKFMPTPEELKCEVARIKAERMTERRWTDEEEKELRRRPDTRFGDDEQSDPQKR